MFLVVSTWLVISTGLVWLINTTGVIWLNNTTGLVNINMVWHSFTGFYLRAEGTRRRFGISISFILDMQLSWSVGMRWAAGLGVLGGGGD